MSNCVGRAVRRREDAPLLTGRGHFVDDLSLPGMLFLGIARSPHAHARITSLNTAPAAQLAGVVDVMTATDLHDLPDMPLNARARDMTTPPNPVLARDTVNAVGAPVAAVVAESRALAEDAAALIEVDYEPLPGVSDAATALAPGSAVAWKSLQGNLTFKMQRRGGEPEAAFERADQVISVSVNSPRIAAAAIEPRAVLAAPDPMGDGLTVWVSAQSPFRLRGYIARFLRVPENRVRIITPDVGGAFGAKNNLYREYVLAAMLAFRTQRPVKWVASRTEDFLGMQQGRDMRIDVDLAVRGDGTFEALRVRNVANLGAYVQPAGIGPPQRPLNQSPGCYAIPNAAVEVAGVVTNTTGTGPYRGAGRPESVLLIERAVDAAARQLGADPIALRRQNFVPASDFPHRNVLGAVYDSGDYERALDRALELSDYEGLLVERDAARAMGGLMGIGLATFIEPSAGAGFESGVVRIEQTGKVTAVTGSSAHGQGHETTFAQVLSDRLGVPMSDIVVLHGDTLGVPQAVGTFGSRSTALGGSALVMAAERVVDKARRMAAHLLEASPADIAVHDGRFSIAGATDRSVGWPDLAAAAYSSLDLPDGDEPGLEATAFFTPESEAFGFGAHIACVEVDPDTGRLCVRRLVCVDDCGTVLNPLLVEGQVVGGIAQGLGQALMEQVVYDVQGQLQSGSFGDYAVPRAVDMPGFDALTLAHTVTPSPWNPLGVKGVGESGTVGAPAAIANAVVDALAPLGVKHVDMPFTAEKLWRLIHGA
jgi:carbon-monoxide dehydrogenase large subunit